MPQVPKRVAVIGLSGAIRRLIEKHIAEGFLPTFKRIFETGAVAENCLVPFPTITTPQWATIATGTWPGTHGITDFWLYKPKEHPEAVQVYSSHRLQAETIWEAADKVGKKCIVLNYPGSWPSRMKNGIVVAGAGVGPGEYKDGIPGMGIAFTLCGEQLLTSDSFQDAIRGEFRPAEGWANVSEMGTDPLEMEAMLLFPFAKERPADTTWYVLARQMGKSGYDRVTLSATKDVKDAFCTLAVGEWSPKIVTPIRMKDGSEREVFFRCKLIELSPDAKGFRLFLTALAETSGWSSPAVVARQIVSEEGIFTATNILRRGHMNGWFDLDTYVEIDEHSTQWLTDAAMMLLTKYEWDLFFMHAHPPDSMYHMFLTDMDPLTCQDEARRKKAWDTHLRIYQSVDHMLARILKVLDEGTLVVLVSDHGATPAGSRFNPYDALIAAGLAAFEEQRGQSTLLTTESTYARTRFSDVGAFLLRVDSKRSKAIIRTPVHIYVNLKGRDPEGVVEPDDCEKVQQEIIDALLSYVDPSTGKRPVALALSKKDARLLGLYGDSMGDVVYAVYPWYGSVHGAKLPTADWGIGSLNGLLVLMGPGIKNGHRLQRTAWLTDLVPTICYLTGLPLPEQAEGAVLYQAFEAPNFRLKEVPLRRSGARRRR